MLYNIFDAAVNTIDKPGSRNHGKKYIVFTMEPNIDYPQESDIVKYPLFPGNPSVIAKVEQAIANNTISSLAPFNGKIVIIEDLPPFYRTYPYDTVGVDGRQHKAGEMVVNKAGLPVIHTTMRVFVPTLPDETPREDPRSIALRQIDRICIPAIETKEEYVPENVFGSEQPTSSQMPVNQQVNGQATTQPGVQPIGSPY